MSNTKKVVLIVTAVLVVCLIGAGTVLLAGYGGEFPNILIPSRGGTAVRIDESETLSTNGVAKVSIECVIGRIIIEKGDARAELTGNITTNAEKEKYLVVEPQGDTLNVRFDAQTNFPDYLNGDVTMRVWLPDGLDVSAFGASAGIDVDGLQFGNASFRSVSGAVGVNDCSGQNLEAASTSGAVKVQSAGFGRTNISSTSGGVHVGGAAGDVTVNNISGAVRVENADGDVSVGNTSGSVFVSQTQSNPSVNVSTISGSAEIRLRGDASFDLTARSTSGSLTTDFDVMVSGSLKAKITGTDVQGSVNGGGENVSITTVSGSIRVTKQ